MIHGRSTDRRSIRVGTILDHSIHPSCSFSSKAPKSDSTFPLFKYSDPADMQPQHMHPRVIAPLPKRASGATAHTAHWECLPTLNSVDWWLSIVTRKPGKVSFSEGQIVCFLERVCIEAPKDNTIFVDPPTYTLYVTAQASLRSAFEGMQQSPRAILDQFVGWPGQNDAPQWVRWPYCSVFFQQSTAAAVKLFKELSTWSVNTGQPGLPLRMIVWARSVDDWARHLKPRTPQTRRALGNVQTPKRNSLSQHTIRCIDESPTTALCKELWVVEASEEECRKVWGVEASENVLDIEASVAKVLDFGPPPIPFSEAQPRFNFNRDVFEGDYIY
ncbi:hypothetical protein PILCRDRAFT_544114 [Piloderma croceum F 1598]|uniref:Uncharacterized protein n=1 Tax=Piloderma croceum (strain F 1598) TaxID=765440 RepID=A0A0C3B1M9_PILCF|nr:hypothetical protein PILCRDRAFT_544114 [Piloderma croceum F 1598]